MNFVLEQRNGKLMEDSKFEKIKIDRIMPSVENTYETDSFGELCDNIRSVGLITPLTVLYHEEEDSYEILSGCRRFRALQKIHKEEGLFDTVPCYVCQGSLSTDDKILIIEYANLQTRQIDRRSHEQIVTKILLKKQEVSQVKSSEVVKELEKYGINRRNAYRNVAIAKNAVPELQEMYKDNQISKIDAATLSTSDEGVQKEAIKRAKSGENIHSVVKEVKKNKRPNSVSETLMIDDFEEEIPVNNKKTQSEDRPEVKQKEVKEEKTATLSKEREQGETENEVRVWLKRMLLKEADELSEEEKKTIRLCKQVSNHFSSMKEL